MNEKGLINTLSMFSRRNGIIFIMFHIIIIKFYYLLYKKLLWYSNNNNKKNFNLFEKKIIGKIKTDTFERKQKLSI
jgi:hypothetical protein